MAVYLHAWIGVRDILMDYVKPTTLRLALLVVVAVAVFAYTAWTVQILWSL
jgi:succinate dehydrogenase / fumarate reductase membrane anchor subunit